MTPFDKFLEKFIKGFSGKDPMIFSVLGNVFSMRIIGNKTHGDLAEIALTEYINRFVDGFTAKHTGKEKFRAKEFEEDIRITETSKIKEILDNKCFKDFGSVNVLPLIYNEKEMKFKVIVFDLQKAHSSVRKIKFLPPRKIGRKKTFPIYKFFDNKNNYIFEVRYGDAKANALQRGMWTHTENAEPFFKELLAGGYKINEP